MALKHVAAAGFVAVLAAACGAGGGDVSSSEAGSDGLVFEFGQEAAPRELEPDEVAGLSQATWVGAEWLAPDLTGAIVGSSDGAVWSDVSTTGLPADVGFASLRFVEGRWVGVVARGAEWPASPQRWLVSSTDGRAWSSVPFPEVDGWSGDWRSTVPVAVRGATVVVSGLSVDLESDTVEPYSLSGPIDGPLRLTYGVPAVAHLVADDEGFVALSLADEATTVHRSADGAVWEQVGEFPGYVHSIERVGGVLVVGGETAPEDERVGQILTSADGGRTWVAVPLGHGLDGGWVTLAQGDAGVIAFAEGSPPGSDREWHGRAYFSTDGVEWVELDWPLRPDETHQVPILGIADDHLLALDQDTEGAALSLPLPNSNDRR